MAEVSLAARLIYSGPSDVLSVGDLRHFLNLMRDVDPDCELNVFTDPSGSGNFIIEGEAEE